MLTPNRIFFLLGSALVPLAAYFVASRFRPDSTRRRSLEWVLVAAFAAGLTVTLTYPFSLHPSDQVIGIADSRVACYIQAREVHGLRHPWQLFDANIFFPARNTLAYSENMLGNVTIFAPFYLASNNPILAFNAVALSTFLFSFITMYWLMKRMTGTVWAALVAALVYAFVGADLSDGKISRH